MRTLLAALLWLTLVNVEAGDPFNGHRIYGEHCLQCHGDDGSGLLVGIPDFTRGEGLLKSDLELVEQLKRGVGTMPAYQGLLSENELADVITYTRTLQ
ncbi:MAG: cytochrome c [Chromatiales bacterium]|nr:cytochrome c [Chromatiales bacterium]